ncbi:MAG TPA: hypothetical protein VJY62_17350 [Bacteroidia bacterium]|nr:hypothetical protein [Bacteroidia bacterium]
MRILPITILLFAMSQGCMPESENKTEEVEQSSYKAETQLTYKNPALMGGSDFLNLFKRLQINQQYRTMMIFTSNATKKKFGENNILEFYEKNLQLGFDVKLKSVRYNPDSTTCRLNYQATIYATKETRTIECVIENDSAKISLKNLKTIFFNMK